MNEFLYPILLAGDVLFLLLIFLFVKHGKLSVRYSLAWFGLGAVLLVFAAFPVAAKMLRAVLRFEVVANMVFTGLFCFVLLVLLILSAAASVQAEQLKRMAQHSALLEERVRQLEQAAGEKAGGGPGSGQAPR